MLHQQLQRLEAAGTPLQVGIIGAGTFGTQIISRTCRMAGMRVAAIADLQPDRAAAALKLGGIGDDRIRKVKSAKEIDEAMLRHVCAITTSVDELVASRIDVVVEATGNAEAGARHGHAAISHGKHLVMVTIEADVVVGPLLKRQADAAGTLYSLAYGDEPALAVELCDWARTLGFRVIAAGKGTRFLPEFRHATPDDVPRMYGFTGKDFNAQVFCSFLDGTKHAIEMATLANAAGLTCDVRGMHFPGADLREMPDVLSHRSRGGILETEGVAEAVSSLRRDGTPVERSLRGGVYAVVASVDDYPIESLASYGEIIGMMIGRESRQAMIYRPQHFVGHEVPFGVAKMMIYKEPLGAPDVHACDVIAAAKRNLEPGEVLDGEGGFAVYGLLERSDVTRRERLMPIGLTQGAVVTRPIKVDEPITYENVEPRDSFLLSLRRKQDQGEAGE